MAKRKRLAETGKKLVITAESAQYDDNASGVHFVGDSLVCVPPFGFGVQQGDWVLTLSARGYPVQAVEFEAEYAVFRSECGSYNDSGSVVSLEISRAP